MPHYADGSEAKVGDQVFGTLFNSGDKPKSGVIVSITTGVESCNAMVQFTEVDFAGIRPRMALHSDMGRVIKTEAHCSSGPEAVAYVCADYCNTSGLTKVG